jgi:protein-S-isoprenylcysteine O-methyltransferase Ste14
MQMVERAIVWTGGAMFVGSLALCTVWYLVVFDRERPPHGWQPVVTDIVFFSLFATHHSVLARDGVKRKLAAIVPPRLQRSCYVWIASSLLVGVCVCWQPVGGEVYEAHGLRALVHAVVQLGGLWLIASSVARIDALELAGIRPASHVGELQVGGPYRFVRHPLYLGWMLAVFGTARMTGDRLAFALMTSAYLMMAIPWEEQSLARAFGDAYARYKLIVRWRMIPFIY